jgi:hypothetical protein
MTRKKLYPSVSLVLAMALFAGCSKSNKPNPEAPPANTPAATQPAGDQQAQPQQQQPAANVPPANAPAAASGPTVQQPAQTSQAQAPAPAPAALPAVPAGTVLRVRMGQTINVKHAASGQPFSGAVVDPIVVDGNTVIPAGSTAEGMVVRAHKRGRFKGASVLQLTLTGLNINGQHYRIETSSITRTKKGKGKRTAAFIGGGSGLGMLIGGVATGGVGLLVGGLAGAGAGTGVAAFTGNKDITIPAESVVSFRLANSIQLR